MTRRTGRWLFLTTGCAWFKQPDKVRIRVPAERRAAVRVEVEQVAADFRQAAKEPDPERRARLASRKMTELLLIIGQGDRDETDPEALAIGIERVGEALPDGPMRDALEGFRREPPVVPLSRADFRALSELFLWSLTLIDTRSSRERRLEPWIERGALGMVLLVAVWLLFGTRNLAVGRTVTASSICHHTPREPYARPRLDRVVDGIERETAFAMCTNNELHPWVQVDLGEERTVSRVAVHGRADCCWGLDDTPLSVQLSKDGKTFETVAVRQGFILVEFPWNASFSRRRARYVRLANESNQVKNIVISEIEIYGR